MNDFIELHGKNGDIWAININHITAILADTEDSRTLIYTDDSPEIALTVIETCDEIKQIIEAAKESPTVSHGHVVWREREYHERWYKPCQVIDGDTLYRKFVEVFKDEFPYCSVCRKRLSDDFQNYCPNCGAKLDEKPEHIKKKRKE